MSIDVISVVISVVTLLFVVVGWRLSWRAYVYPFRADVLADLYEMAFALEGELDGRLELGPYAAFCKFAGMIYRSDADVSVDDVKREMRRVRVLLFEVQWLWSVSDAKLTLDYLHMYQNWLSTFRVGYFGCSDEHPVPHQDLERRLCSNLIYHRNDLADALPILERSIKYHCF